MVRVGLNGFGRIGEAVMRIWALQEKKDWEIVLLNGVRDLSMVVRSMKYDSVYGTYPGEVSLKDNVLTIDGHDILVTNIREPEKLEWKKHNIDLVIDASGRYRDRDTVQAHFNAGAKRVLITAPAKGDDVTIVMGVNEQDYDPEKHFMISNASCTTNCLAPVVKVLEEKFGIVHAFMTTVHAYTNDQVLVDGSHKDPRRARAAALNIIPTTTGAATATALVLPSMKGKIDGISLRVPTPTVSLVDLNAEMKKDVTVEEVNAALKEAAETTMKGFLGYSDEPLVSMDYKGDPRSSIVDGLSTAVVDGNLLKVIAWYDNEYGYSSRVVDLVDYMIEKGM
ncbi:type I glyceraldehyde-3-phosphate dehydrogenase [Guggenheimella bovis]